MTHEEAELIDQANQIHASGILALASLLVKKGIITPEEFRKAKVAALAEFDQVYQKRKLSQEKATLTQEQMELFKELFGGMP